MQPTFLARFRLVLCATSAEAWTFPFPRPSGPAAVSSPAAGELLFRGESSVEPPHIRFALGSSSSTSSGQAPPSHPLAWEEHVARALTPWNKITGTNTDSVICITTDGEEDDGIDAGGVVCWKTFCAAVRVSESCASDAATESRPRTSIRESSRRRFPRSDSTTRCANPRPPETQSTSGSDSKSTGSKQRISSGAGLSPWGRRRLGGHGGPRGWCRRGCGDGPRTVGRRRRGWRAPRWRIPWGAGGDVEVEGSGHQRLVPQIRWWEEEGKGWNGIGGKRALKRGLWLPFTTVGI